MKNLILLLALITISFNVSANTVEELDAYYDCADEVELQYEDPKLVKELKAECKCEELKECK